MLSSCFVWQARWLREQFEMGALPQDPQLVEAFYEQVGMSPESGYSICNTTFASELGYGISI